jgi:hypothetical protein
MVWASVGSMTDERGVAQIVEVCRCPFVLRTCLPSGAGSRARRRPQNGDVRPPELHVEGAIIQAAGDDVAILVELSE